MALVVGFIFAVLLDLLDDISADDALLARIGELVLISGVAVFVD